MTAVFVSSESVAFFAHALIGTRYVEAGLIASRVIVDAFVNISKYMFDYF